MDWLIDFYGISTFLGLFYAYTSWFIYIFISGVVVS